MLDLALATLLLAAPPSPAPVDESHFLISFRGQTIGKAERRLSSTGEGDAARITLAVEENYRFSTGDRPSSQFSMARRAEMLPDWTPVAMAEKSDESGAGGEVAVRFGAGRAVFQLPGGKEKTVEFRGAAVAEMSGEALLARGLLKTGGQLSAVVPDLARAALVPQQAEVLGEKRVEGRAGKLFLVQVKDATGRVAWDLLVDEAGRLLESSTGEMLRTRVERSRAVLPDAPAALAAGAVPLEGAPEKPWKLDRLVVELTLGDVEKTPVVPEAGGQTVAVSGRKVTVAVSARRPDGRIPEEPLSPAQRSRWLEPEAEPDWKDPKVRNLAASIVKDEASQLRRGYLVGRWVYRNLDKNLGGPPEASAVQALAALAGDCSEHAALFAALARAAGLPARTAWGLVLNEGALRFHVWSEFHAGDRWIPVDTALGRYGLPACYIVMGHDRDEAGVRLFRLYAASRARTVESR
ncbi:MAG TPA: transglutaminase domain-containing protein [Planctomycetota bacterium]|nr:transglutaminase domain-containing protein [Planctomycetota bacterium]